MSRRLVALILLVALVALPAGAGAQTVRRGAWVDEIVAVEEPDSAAGITRLEAGDIQIFAQAISKPDLFRRVLDAPALDYERAYGLISELTFNPAGPVLPDGSLNPFASAKIREAMNWLVDRGYIVKEIHGGLASPKWFPINNAFPDYARVADVAKVLERRYAHDPAKARQVIDDEMRRMGATLVGGKWQYQGKPVTIINLIRTEDERRQIGDYVSSLLEGVGFTVQNRYATAAEASPIWLGSKPEEGKFHVYTGGWIFTAISRDQAGNFNSFYTPRGRPDPLWQAYKPVKEFDELADRLARRDFTSMDERRQMLGRALALALEDSVRVWLVERVSFYPRRSDVSVSADLAGGIAGSFLWPYTVRLGDRIGGTVRVAIPSMLTAPWNPVAGSNWIFDTMLYRATADFPTMPHPHTGLAVPQRVERADVYVKKGLPVGKTLDWVTLSFVDENKVPVDAWIDWDAKTKTFITVGQKHPGGLTANLRVVVRYDQNLFRNVKWHDGSLMSIGDFVMSVILAFDRAKPDSAIYDKAAVPAFQTFQRHFRGFRIVSRDPLVVEYYSDAYTLDAENNAATAAAFAWPWYGFGPGPWHTMALGVFAEEGKQLAWSTAKAKEINKDQMNMIAGPSLAVLRDQLRRVMGQAYIPYEPTLRHFIRTEEAWVRWANFTKFHREKGHFWVGNGPFYLEKAFPVEKVVQLRRNPDFPDAADKWGRFATPLVPVADIRGPTRVAPGTAATFDVRVSAAGQPYAVSDIAEVKYLVFDARGQLALQGDALPVRSGLWQVRLTADQTRNLPVGTTRLEVVIVSQLVSIPATAALDFVIRR